MNETNALSTFTSATYDLLARNGKGWTQYAIMGPAEASKCVQLAAKGHVMAVGNKGDKHYS